MKSGKLALTKDALIYTTENQSNVQLLQVSLKAYKVVALVQLN